MASSDETRIIKIRIKTERAKKYIQEVESLAESFKANEWAAFTHATAETLGEIRPIRIAPVTLVAATGDAIHNLRCALDHLAGQLVESAGNSPGSGTGFPIAESREKFESIFERKVAGMSPQARDAIYSLRPYQGGNESLWLMHHFDIVDKHKQMLAFGYQNFFRGEHFPGMIASRPEQAAHFITVFTDDDGGKYQSAGQPAASQSQIAKSKPLIPTLHELLLFTENLIENFRPFLA